MPYLLRGAILLALMLLPDLLSAQGLVAYWPFNGNANDASGTAPNGVVYGATLTTDRFGNVSSAYHFAGSAYIEVPNSSVFDFDSTTSYTISFWMKNCVGLPGADPGSALFALGKGAATVAIASDRGYAITLYRSVPVFLYSTTTNAVARIQNYGGPTIAGNGWHLVTAVFDYNPANAVPREERLYIDGLLVASAAVSGQSYDYSQSTLPLIMGKNIANNQFYKGAIDDVRMYNRVLSQTEIAALYTAGGWPNITYPTMTASVTGLDPIVICRGDSVRLSSQYSGPVQSFAWLTAPGLAAADTNNPNPVVRPAVSTTYTLQVTNGPPCGQVVTASIRIVVSDGPVLVFRGPRSVCRGDSIVISPDVSRGFLPYRYQWSPGPGVGPLTSRQQTVTPTSNTDYYVTIFDSIGCFVRDTIRVVLYPHPSLTLKRDQYICRGDGVMIGAYATGGSFPYTYRWNNTKSLNSDVVAQPWASPDSTTTYIVTVQDILGCRTSDSVIVHVRSRPTANAGADRVVCSDSSFTIGSSPTPTWRYSWNPSVGLSNANISNPILRASQTANYILTVTDSNGCTATDQVAVTVLHSALMADSVRLDFGSLDGCTSSRDISFEVENSGDAPLTVDALIDTTEFVVLDPAAAFQLAPGERRRITVRYAPTRTGVAAGRLLLHGVPCNVTRLIDLSGEKLQSIVSSSPTTIDFGSSAACDIVERDTTIVVHNNGTAPIDVVAALLPVSYSIIAPSLPATVAVGDSMVITVRYMPVTPGLFAGDIRFPYRSGTCQDTMRVTVRGDHRLPLLTIPLSVIDFGSSEGCDSILRDTIIVVRNNSIAPVEIDAGTLPVPYTIIAPPLPATIPIGDSISITVRYMPTSVGSFIGDILIPYKSGTCRDTMRIAVMGTHFLPRLSLNVSALDFGRLGGCDISIDTTIIVQNDGAYPVDLTSFRTDPGFTLVTPLPLTLRPGESRTITLRFLPVANGRSSGSIRLQYGTCKQEAIIDLEGIKTGTSFTLPDTVDFGVVLSCKDSAFRRRISITYRGDSGSIGSVSYVGMNGPFTTDLTSGVSFPEGRSMDVEMSMIPGADGIFSGAMDVRFEPCGVLKQVILRGEIRSMSLTTQGLDFGSHPFGSTTDSDVVYLNNGSVPLRVDTLDGVVPPFTLLTTRPLLPAIIQPGDSLVATLRFRAGQHEDRSPVRGVVGDPCHDIVIGEITGRGDLTATALVRIPVVSGRPGERILVPIELVSSEGLDAAGGRRFEARILYNGRLLISDGAPSVAIDSIQRRIILTGERKAQSGVLTEAGMIVALGDSESTALVLESFIWLDSGSQIATTTIDGEFRLEGICRDGGRRLVTTRGELALRPVRPNPVGDYAEIEYEIVEDGRTRLYLVDATGRYLLTLVDQSLSPGRYSIPITTHGLPSGVYYVTLQTPTANLIERFTVEK